MRDTRRVIAGLLLGLTLGVITAMTHSSILQSVAMFVQPVGTIWVNAIRMTVIPLVVSLLITGVASAEDMKTVGRVGRKTVLVFVGLLTGSVLVIGPIALLVGPLLPRDPAFHPALPAGAAEAASEIAKGASQVPSIADWLISLIPTNPIRAAAEGAMIPLIIFTLLLALAISRCAPAHRETLVRFFQALAEAMQVLVRWVIAAAPIGVFALMFSLTARTGIGLAGAIGAYIVVYSLADILFVLLTYPVVALVAKVPIRTFARANLPPLLIGASSSSSIATLPALIHAAEGELGVSKEISGFVLPLAVATFKYAAPVAWMVGTTFVAWFYRIDLHVQQIAIVGFAAVVLSFAAPGVPRGAFLMLAPLFSALGLPIEGIGILIAVDAIPDLFSTLLNVTGDLAATAIVAHGGRVAVDP